MGSLEETGLLYKMTPGPFCGLSFLRIPGSAVQLTCIPAHGYIEEEMKDMDFLLQKLSGSCIHHICSLFIHEKLVMLTCLSSCQGVWKVLYLCLIIHNHFIRKFLHFYHPRFSHMFNSNPCKC